ncbi:MAG: exosortase B [Methylotenera sp.]|nr:MAG: exosortase B [Methylotenera sp.]
MQAIAQNFDDLKSSPYLMWVPIVIGLLALYIPTYNEVFNNLWVTEDQGHGPIVLMVIVFLFWQKREHFSFTATDKPAPILGGLTLVFGLLCYTAGRSQDIFILDLASQIFVLSGIFLLMRGLPMLKALWFPLFFIIFMIPFPLDSLTLPMKMAVSYVTETILFWFDYPIAREGVILQIGQYQLLVADACAGMHTLISLEALGLLYLSLVKHDSLIRNVTLTMLIIPISFTANVIRVITLTLITYYFGDEVGQGFVHGFAGFLLFFVALMFIMTVDSMLQYFVKFKQKIA